MNSSEITGAGNLNETRKSVPADHWSFAGAEQSLLPPLISRGLGTPTSCSCFEAMIPCKTSAFLQLPHHGAPHYDISVNCPIPSAVGDLPYLDLLQFGWVKNLTGPISHSLAKLPRLRFLRINNSPLSTSIPDYLDHIQSLEYLELDQNQLYGPIPASLSNLSKLRDLDLSRNKLTGSIPVSFGSFTSNLYRLALYENQLSDGKATFIDLSNNLLDFDLSKVRFPKNLTYLDLSRNRIRGSIPKQATKMKWKKLNLSYNQLCGKIPQGGQLQLFSAASFAHNQCLCGPPLSKCK
uniref:Polygalacturonase inhibitor-like n=1 Tax=Nelumbo nucifera TaxID=4432 RepID=A0A822YBU7_NELNU|nr:TPA_asm: hypothetical protein HUJ06_031385 [Nelumbo nucifera]